MRSPWLFQCHRLHRNRTILSCMTFAPKRIAFNLCAGFPHIIRIHPRSSPALFPVDFAPSNQKPRLPSARNLHLIKLWNPRGINVAARTNGIQAHRTHHIPSTHLSAILIANQPIRTVFIKLFAHIVNDPLCLFRLPAIVIQIRHVMTGFVPMRILSY